MVSDDAKKAAIIGLAGLALLKLATAKKETVVIKPMPDEKPVTGLPPLTGELPLVTELPPEETEIPLVTPFTLPVTPTGEPTTPGDTTPNSDITSTGSGDTSLLVTDTSGAVDVAVAMEDAQQKITETKEKTETFIDQKTEEKDSLTSALAEKQGRVEDLELGLSTAKPGTADSEALAASLDSAKADVASVQGAIQEKEVQIATARGLKKEIDEALAKVEADKQAALKAARASEYAAYASLCKDWSLTPRPADDTVDLGYWTERMAKISRAVVAAKVRVQNMMAERVNVLTPLVPVIPDQRIDGLLGAADQKKAAIDGINARQDRNIKARDSIQWGKINDPWYEMSFLSGPSGTVPEGFYGSLSLGSDQPEEVNYGSMSDFIIAVRDNFNKSGTGKSLAERFYYLYNLADERSKYLRALINADIDLLQTLRANYDSSNTSIATINEMAGRLGITTVKYNCDDGGCKILNVTSNSSDLKDLNFEALAQIASALQSQAVLNETNARVKNDTIDAYRSRVLYFWQLKRQVEPNSAYITDSFIQIAVNDADAALQKADVSSVIEKKNNLERNIADYEALVASGASVIAAKNAKVAAEGALADKRSEMRQKEVHAAKMCHRYSWAASLGTGVQGGVASKAGDYLLHPENYSVQQFLSKVSEIDGWLCSMSGPSETVTQDVFLMSVKTPPQDVPFEQRFSPLLSGTVIGTGTTINFMQKTGTWNSNLKSGDKLGETFIDSSGKLMQKVYRPTQVCVSATYNPATFDKSWPDWRAYGVSASSLWATVWAPLGGYGQHQFGEAIEQDVKQLASEYEAKNSAWLAVKDQVDSKLVKLTDVTPQLQVEAKLTIKGAVIEEPPAVQPPVETPAPAVDIPPIFNWDFKVDRGAQNIVKIHYSSDRDMYTHGIGKNLMQAEQEAPLISNDGSLISDLADKTVMEITLNNETNHFQTHIKAWMNFIDYKTKNELTRMLLFDAWFEPKDQGVTKTAEEILYCPEVIGTDGAMGYITLEIIEDGAGRPISVSPEWILIGQSVSGTVLASAANAAKEIEAATGQALVGLKEAAKGAAGAVLGGLGNVIFDYDVSKAVEVPEFTWSAHYHYGNEFADLSGKTGRGRAVVWEELPQLGKILTFAPAKLGGCTWPTPPKLLIKINPVKPVSHPMSVEVWMQTYIGSGLNIDSSTLLATGTWYPPGSLSDGMGKYEKDVCFSPALAVSGGARCVLVVVVKNKTADMEIKEAGDVSDWFYAGPAEYTSPLDLYNFKWVLEFISDIHGAKTGVCNGNTGKPRGLVVADLPMSDLDGFPFRGLVTSSSENAQLNYKIKLESTAKVLAMTGAASLSPAAYEAGKTPDHIMFSGHFDGGHPEPVVVTLGCSVFADNDYSKPYDTVVFVKTTIYPVFKGVTIWSDEQVAAFPESVYPFFTSKEVWDVVGVFFIKVEQEDGTLLSADFSPRFPVGPAIDVLASKAEAIGVTQDTAALLGKAETISGDGNTARLVSRAETISGAGSYASLVSRAETIRGNGDSATLIG